MFLSDSTLNEQHSLILNTHTKHHGKKDQ